MSSTQLIKTSLLPLVTDLTAPSAVCVSGDTALASLYEHTLTDLLPSSDEASHAVNKSLLEQQQYLLDRALPRAFILAGIDEDDESTATDNASSRSTSAGCIYQYNPATNQTYLLAIGLPSPHSLSCTPCSDLIWLDTCIVKKKNSNASYSAVCVKCIAGQDVMNYAAENKVVPSSLHSILTVLPPSVSAVTAVLQEDGTIVVACKRERANPNTARGDPNTARGNLNTSRSNTFNSSSSLGLIGPNTARRHESEAVGGTILSYAPTPRSQPLQTASPLKPPTHAHFTALGLGFEPRINDMYVYDPYNPIRATGSATCIINDIAVSPFTKDLLIAGGGGGPGATEPPAVSIFVDGEPAPLPLSFGFADCVTIGGGPSFNTFPSHASLPDTLVPASFVSFFLTSTIKGTSLLGLYSNYSSPARLIRTREAASVHIPETPRPITPREEADDDVESVVSSAPDANEDLDLFNDLSNALAAEDGDRDLARRAAMVDPTLSKTGPVNVKVVLRCRPLLKRELKEMIPSCVRCTRNSVTVDGSFLPGKTSRTFDFDRVFSPETSQRQVYVEVVAPIVHRVLDGFKCTVFAYGQTGSGKTYSMEGEAGTKGADASGLIPRAVHSLFDELNSDKACKYSITASHMEIYLENPYDLLASDANGGRWSAGSHMKQKLTIVENFVGNTADEAVKTTSVKNNQGVQIIGLSEVMVKKPADIFKIMHRTKQNRHSAETLCNRASSRSHAVFTLNVTLTKRAEGGGQVTRRGRLHLVDLSGSESIKRSGAEGIHAQEAAIIGKSLLSLGRVIRSLVAHDNHVPYRESKLTRILSDSLGGSSYTALILAITPNSEMVGETMSTLSYGMLARNVTNTPKSDVTVMKKKIMRKDENGNMVEVDEDGEVIDADGLDTDGGLKSLHGKALSDLLAVARMPWKASVPIRTRQPGEKNSQGDKVPIGNVNLTPRVFHGETVEWAKLILGGDDGELTLSPPAHAAFVEIFNRFDYRRCGMLNREQIQAMDYVVGEDSASPLAEEFLARFWRNAKILSMRSRGGGSDYGRVDRGPKGHMNLDAYLRFIRDTTANDPLAVRSMLNKAGYSLSFGKLEKATGDEGLIAGSGLMTDAQKKVIEEEAQRVEERDRKKHSANDVGGANKAASKSKVAYDALEKIKAIASKQDGFDLKAAFKQFDLDGNGTVDHDELRAVIAAICEVEDEKGKTLRVAKWEMDAIIELFDPNNDGDIDYGEFSWTFYNRRALVNKDSEGGVGVVSEEPASPTSRGGRRNKKKKKGDPDPVMPPPPKSAGFVKLSRVLSSDALIEFTPRDERGFVIAPAKKDGIATADETKTGVATSRYGGASSRRPLSALQLRQVVEDNRDKTTSSLTNLGGSGNNSSSKNLAGSKSTNNIKHDKAPAARSTAKPRDWQEWVIKSRNTWMRQASRPAGGGNMVDLRGGAMAKQQNASHPRMPKLW
jgi:hypothetical protein